ncbi:hypothetical protein P879_11677 [Paragonimus westermani]|uniref:Uncharacterized protein n=1 Tax=Paragonimus westermani TaxID=34504 RepID=A0A8T0D747_9TREM|nr:hypothetical protein P879_11677 [Paragonimus westermani]
MVVHIPEEAKFEKLDLERTLRLLVAGGAELSGSVNANFATFLNHKEATHVLVPVGYNRKSDRIPITPEMVYQSVNSGKLISEAVL